MTHPPIQRLLRLWLAGPDLGSPVVAWTLDDPVVGRADDDLPEAPPYPSAVAAMVDGWRVISIATQSASTPGHEFRLSFLPHEVVLERFAGMRPHPTDPAHPNPALEPVHV